MNVVVLEEAGYSSAMRGLTLSFLQPLERMPRVALELTWQGQPHCKFLRQMHVWAEITGPWYWWKHMQTYNVGADWPDFQSSSTMHKLLSRPLTQEDFEQPVSWSALRVVNLHIENGDLFKAANELPGGFIYTRVLCFNYAALIEIVRQRKHHKLPEWHTFIDLIVPQLEHQEFFAHILDQEGIEDGDG